MSHAHKIKSLVSKITPQTDMVISAVLATIDVVDAHEVTEVHDGAGTPKIFTRQFPSSNLTKVEVEGYNGWEDITDEVKLVEHLGMFLKKSGVFPRGYSNIKFIYTAGYETLPSDLQGAIASMVEYETERLERGDIKSESIDDYSVTFNNQTPSHIIQTFNRYKNYYV